MQQRVYYYMQYRRRLNNTIRERKDLLEWRDGMHEKTTPFLMLAAHLGADIFTTSNKDAVANLRRNKRADWTEEYI